MKNSIKKIKAFIILLLKKHGFYRLTEDDITQIGKSLDAREDLMCRIKVSEKWADIHSIEMEISDMKVLRQKLDISATWS